MSTKNIYLFPQNGDQFIENGNLRNLNKQY